MTDDMEREYRVHPDCYPHGNQTYGDGMVCEHDAELMALRMMSRNSDPMTGPRVGDWVVFADGETARVSYRWDNGVQTSPGGSFHLSESGAISYSGGLDPLVPFDVLNDTGQTRMGNVWIFHHARWGAGRGAHHVVALPVWACTMTRRQAEDRYTDQAAQRRNDLGKTTTTDDPTAADHILRDLEDQS